MKIQICLEVFQVQMMASDGENITPISTDGIPLAILIKHKMQNKLYSHPLECDRGQNKLNGGKKER